MTFFIEISYNRCQNWKRLLQIYFTNLCFNQIFNQSINYNNNWKIFYLWGFSLIQNSYFSFYFFESNLTKTISRGRVHKSLYFCNARGFYKYLDSYWVNIQLFLKVYLGFYGICQAFINYFYQFGILFPLKGYAHSLLLFQKIRF